MTDPEQSDDYEESEDEFHAYVHEELVPVLKAELSDIVMLEEPPLLNIPPRVAPPLATFFRRLDAIVEDASCFVLDDDFDADEDGIFFALGGAFAYYGREMFGLADRFTAIYDDHTEAVDRLILYATNYGAIQLSGRALLHDSLNLYSEHRDRLSMLTETERVATEAAYLRLKASVNKNFALSLAGEETRLEHALALGEAATQQYIRYSTAALRLNGASSTQLYLEMMDFLGFNSDKIDKEPIHYPKASCTWIDGLKELAVEPLAEAQGLWTGNRHYQGSALINYKGNDLNIGRGKVAAMLRAAEFADNVMEACAVTEGPLAGNEQFAAYLFDYLSLRLLNDGPSPYHESLGSLVTLAEQVLCYQHAAAYFKTDGLVNFGMRLQAFFRSDLLLPSREAHHSVNLLARDLLQEQGFSTNVSRSVYDENIFFESD